MKKIIAVIVTYNGIKWINDCLLSLKNSTIEVEIVVVDNNSTDATLDFIKNNFPSVILFPQNQNLGFGKANNIGMRYALEQNADFVFLLNQDAKVEKDTIEKLIEVAETQPEFGILSPIQTDYLGKKLEDYFFRFMGNDTSKEFYSDFVLGNMIQSVYTIEFVQAAAWLLPINTLKKIGGFDPVFFHYGEDDNYCHRVLYHKLKIGVVPKAVINHDSKLKVNNSLKAFSNDSFSQYELSLLVFYCNINNSNFKKSIYSQRKKNYKGIFLNLLKFNFLYIKGFYNKSKILEKVILDAEKSRNLNINVTPNYLNG